MQLREHACMHAVIINPKHLWETCSLCRQNGAEDACSAHCTSTEARPLYELESLYFATPEHGEWQMDADICWHLYTGVTDEWQHVTFLELDLNFSGVAFHAPIIDSHINFVLDRDEFFLHLCVVTLIIGIPPYICMSTYSFINFEYVHILILRYIIYIYICVCVCVCVKFQKHPYF